MLLYLDSIAEYLDDDGFPRVPVVVLDESYCNLHHTRRETWYHPNEDHLDRSGVGKRFNIIGAVVYWTELQPSPIDGAPVIKLLKSTWVKLPEEGENSGPRLWETNVGKKAGKELADYHLNVNAVRRRPAQHASDGRGGVLTCHGRGCRRTTSSDGLAPSWST